MIQTVKAINQRKTPKRVINCLKALKDGGKVNMYNRQTVIDEAFEIDYWAGYWLALSWRIFGYIIMDFGNEERNAQNDTY